LHFVGLKGKTLHCPITT